MNLASLQTSFRAWLQRGVGELPLGFAAAELPGLRVYRNNYRAQLINCLEQSFPKTRDWIGADEFAEAAAQHVDRIAPVSWTIDAYAAGFPATLETTYQKDEHVGELAWLEWALGECFISADEAAVGPSELLEVDWDRAVLKLSRSIMIRDARTNAGAIWSSLALEQTPPVPHKLSPGSAHLLWRTGFDARFRTIDELERRSLETIRSGRSFAALCDELIDAIGEWEGVRAASEFLGRWISDGLIVAVCVGNDLAKSRSD